MGKENPRDIHFEANEKDYVIPGDSFVMAEDEFLENLCAMCKKSRLTCENEFIRTVEVPLGPNENLDDHGIRTKERQPDGTYIDLIIPFRWADAVAEGIYKTEKDIPEPFICQWFDPKDPG